MVFNLPSTKAKEEKRLIDTQEAFNLWDLLSSKYDIVEKLQIFEIIAHDKDLKLILKYYINEFNENVVILERELEKYSVKGPHQNIAGSKQPSNPELFYDQQIARDIFLFLQEHIENLLRTLRSSTTNDLIRKIIHNMTVDTITKENKIVVYLKIKGWMQTPPLYHDTPKNLDEKLTACEAYHIWDFLTVRYDNMRQTQIFSSFAFDGDFKKVLEIGITQLKNQILVLENELKRFGIPFPQKPSKIIVKPDDSELFDDDHMFRLIINGIQGTLIIHAQALKQATFNDRLRQLFKKIIIEEIDFQDKMYKFGKLKGWLNSVPSYRET